MPQPVDPADLPMPATPAADTLSWDWRAQPDLDRLATILARHGVTLRQVDTGSDQYEVEVSSTPAAAIHASGPLAGQPVGHGRVGWIDAARRWEWAAALRWAADEAAEPFAGAQDGDLDSTDLRQLADRIEAGVLTPWADQPEPATPPAVPSVAAPAAAGPHPATPDRPGVLGRALLDEDGGLWPLVGEEDAHRCGVVTPSIRHRFEADRGQCREVLLVSPAAGRVLDAARQVAALDSLGDYQDWRRVAALHRELRAAVDAADGDQPPDPAERDQALHDALREDAEMDALLRDDDDAGPAPEQAAEAFNAWAASVAEPTPEPDSGRWACRGCGDQFGPGDATDGDVEPWCVMCRTAGADMIRETDSGPGWNRVWLLDCMVASLPGSSYNEPDLHDEAWRQVLALLADRDRLERLGHEYEGMHRQKMAWEREAHRLRGELAEVTADRNRLRDALNQEVEEAVATRAELAGARRDAAADALQMAGAKLAMQQHHTCADVVRGLAAEVRDGRRPVPGSPQPASEGEVATMAERIHPFISPRTLALILPGSDDQRFTGEQWRRMVMPPCPKCGTTIRADRIDVTYRSEMVRHYWFGRWECPNECDPRPAPAGGQEGTDA